MERFSIVYREPGSPAPKQTTVESIGESYIRSECAGKGWQVLFIKPLEKHGLGYRLQNALTGNIKLSFRISVSTAELCMFCEIMRALYMAGVQMMQIIDMCIQEETNEWFKKRLLVVQERLRSGDDLSTAMGDRRCVKAFPLLMRETVRIGEANGRLGDSLSRLIVTFKRAVETKRETVSAMVYPVIALLVFAGVGVVLARTIPPMLQDIVGKKNLPKVMKELPIAIQILFYIYYHPVCLVYLPATLFTFITGWKFGMKRQKSRTVLTKVQRKVPVIGELLYKFALVRFLDMLAANHETGIQISDSLQLIRGTVDDGIIEVSLDRIRKKIVSKGESLSSSISLPEEETVYPGLVRQMIRAGEESGKLSDMVRPIVDFYEGQAKALLKRAVDMMTPAMILLLGGMIGPVVIGVYRTMLILAEKTAS